MVQSRILTLSFSSESSIEEELKRESTADVITILMLLNGNPIHLMATELLFFFNIERLQQALRVGAKTLEIAYGHCARVTCLGLSPDSNYLVTGLAQIFFPRRIDIQRHFNNHTKAIHLMHPDEQFNCNRMLGVTTDPRHCFAHEPSHEQLSEVSLRTRGHVTEKPLSKSLAPISSQKQEKEKQAVDIKELPPHQP
ncbi:hypothetical protein KIW84_053901 [Lathyrus oleraceus]|uniref:Uncharacterized protein n=1 Tax=Pisum sativum TaxID=3888 RepID=A0A9D4WWD4_PEA|nr:hypothetical protein KIW84_053901 [Pisum sativum]